MSNASLSTVPADGLALLGPRSSVGTLITDLDQVPCVYTYIWAQQVAPLIPGQ